MPENLKCSLCSKPATVHLTQIVNNKIVKVDLCEECAQAKGVTDPQGFSLADMLNKTNLVESSSSSSERQLKCDACGMTTADFRRTGRLGCADCYDTFVPLLRPVLEDMHAGIVHKGKIPVLALERQSSAAELQGLENALLRAIEEEAYEDAARFRDQIRALKEATAEETVHP